MSLLRNKKIITLFVAPSLFILSLRLVHAQCVEGESWVKKVLKRELIPSDCACEAVQCSIDDLIVVGINIFQLMLGVLGSLALLFFVYGGLVWMFSKGNQQTIEKGRGILKGAILGIVVVLSSWLMVNFIIAVLTGQFPGDLKNITIFGQPWWQLSG